MFDTINKKIITFLHIEDLPIEQRKDALKEVGIIVYEEIMLRAIEALHEKEKGVFEKLLEVNQDPDAILTFLSEHLLTFNSIVDESIQSAGEESKEIIR